jgi:hypothetical protein
MRITAGWLATSLALTLAAPMAFASVTLEGLEVIGTPDKLHVMLKSHQLIPARVVSQSADAVVLELSNIDTRSPIATRFSGQSLVSHVSMQALDDTRMRIVLRGEALPGADIAFKPVQAPPASVLFQYEEPAKNVNVVKPAVKKPAKAISKPNPQPAAPQNDLIEAITTSPKKPKAFATAPAAHKINAPISAPVIETLPPEGHVDAATSEAFNQTADKTHLEKTDPYEPLITAINGDPAADVPAKAPVVAMQANADLAETPVEQESKKAFDGLNWLQTVAPGLLGGVLMALGGGALFWFFKRPARHAAADYADYWDDEAPPADPPRRVKRQGSRPDGMLGLSALQQPEPAYAPARPAVNPSGIRHYQKAESPRNTGKLATERLASMTRDDYDITREEVRRSAGVKHRQVEAFQPPKAAAATINRRNGVRESLSQLQTAKNGLPANPEVLDFLKSVADYMDRQPPGSK